MDLRRFVFPDRRCAQRRRLYRRHLQDRASEVLEPRTLLTAVVMTDYEQLLLELINRGRADPEAEAVRYERGLNEGIDPGSISSDPKQPLAPNQLLLNAAVGHSLDMLERDFFSHTNPSNVTYDQRIVAAGYTPYQAIGENIAFVGTTGTVDQEAYVHASHRNLYRSKTGHRQALMNPAYREVGPGVRFGVFTDEGTDWNSIMVTENFGRQSGNAFLTGVVYTDADSDDFYSVGEAIRSGTISATNLATGVTWTEPIGVSGGYRLAVPDGDYEITASWTLGQTPQLATATATVAGSNVKVDFETGSVTSVTLSLEAAASSLPETGSGTSTTITVTRSGDLGQAVTVALSNADATELALPASVSIPAGQASAVFTVTAVDDALIDGSQSTSVSASFSGYQGGATSVTTVDTTTPTLPDSVTESTTARPVFAWTGVGNASTYDLWVNDSSGHVVLNQSNVAGTQFTPTSDMDLGTFYAWVRGRTAGGVTSPWSPIATYRVRTRPLVQTSGTSATDDFTIRWDSVPGAARYDVWVNRLTSGTSQYYRNAGVTGTSVAVTDFAPGRYAIWVNSQTSEGFNGIWSAQTVLTVSVPVSGMDVSAPTITGTPVLSWDAVAGATNYDVWVDNLTTQQSQVIRDANVSDTFLSLNGLTAASCRAWVRARDENGGNYAWSEPFDFEHQRASRLLSPSGTDNSGTPLFSWTSVSGATRYELWVSNLDGSGRVIHEQNLTGTTFTPGSSLSSGNYRVWIRAFDSSSATVGWSAAFDFSVAAVHDSDSDAAQLTEVWTDRFFSAAEDVFCLLDQAAESNGADHVSQQSAAQHAGAAMRISQTQPSRSDEGKVKRLPSGPEDRPPQPAAASADRTPVA